MLTLLRICIQVDLDHFVPTLQHVDFLYLSGFNALDINTPTYLYSSEFKSLCTNTTTCLFLVFKWI